MTALAEIDDDATQAAAATLETALSSGDVDAIRAAIEDASTLLESPGLVLAE